MITSVHLHQTIISRSRLSGRCWRKVNESWSGYRTDASWTPPRVTVYTTMNLWFLHSTLSLARIRHKLWMASWLENPESCIDIHRQLPGIIFELLLARPNWSTNLGSHIKSFTPHTTSITRHTTEIFVRLTWSEIDPYKVDGDKDEPFVLLSLKNSSHRKLIAPLQMSCAPCHVDLWRIL